MNIISYRGPGMAGGVSAALSQAWTDEPEYGLRWCYVSDASFNVLTDPGDKGEEVVSIPQGVIDGHYRFCNEFLWPVLHDLPERAVYRAADRGFYREFNTIIAGQTNTISRGIPRWYFVQDYQLALVPALLASAPGKHCSVFWHIPWPRSVKQMHVPPLAEVARGLLSSDIVGFHTDEYADNFLSFVEQHVPGFRVNRADRTVNGRTRLVVAPLGIDLPYWSRLSAGKRDVFGLPRFAALKGRPYVLSVDRADYTKGIVERIEMIDRFFERYPHWRGRVTFAQVCGKTRAGLEAFDAYWQEARQRAESVVARWQDSLWSPLIWYEQPVGAEELALLYRQCDVMLVNPVRDGLNLTAKEFVACQKDRPGVLALSPGAGVYHEIGHGTVPVNPFRANQMARAVHIALSIGESERAARLEAMRASLRENTLRRWWNCFAREARERKPSARALSCGISAVIS